MALPIFNSAARRFSPRLSKSIAAYWSDEHRGLPPGKLQAVGSYRCAIGATNAHRLRSL